LFVEKNKFRHFTVTSRVSRESTVNVIIKIRVRFSLVLVIGGDRTSQREMSGVICRVPDIVFRKKHPLVLSFLTSSQINQFG